MDDLPSKNIFYFILFSQVTSSAYANVLTKLVMDVLSKMDLVEENNRGVIVTPVYVTI